MPWSFILAPPCRLGCAEDEGVAVLEGRQPRWAGAWQTPPAAASSCGESGRRMVNILGEKVTFLHHT